MSPDGRNSAPDVAADGQGIRAPGPQPPVIRAPGPPPEPPPVRVGGFLLDADDPFRHDKLGREAQVTTLCDELVRRPTTEAVLVNGGWGTGKTVFLAMVAAHLRERFWVPVVEFNAWQERYTGDPLADIVSAIAHDMNDSTGEKLKRLATRIAWGLTEHFTKGIVREGVTAGDDTTPGGWSTYKHYVDEARSCLGEAVPATGRPLVVLVDEVDRCPPSYALDLFGALDRVLSVPGVVVVVAVNRSELVQAVRGRYGDGFAAGRYLRRFEALSVDLALPPPADLYSFVTGLFVDTELEGRYDHDSWIVRVLIRLAHHPLCGVRDIEQFVRHFAIASERGKRGDAAWTEAVAALLLLRMVRPDMYERICAGTDDSFAAAGTAFQELRRVYVSPRGWELPADKDRDMWGIATRSPWRTATTEFAAALLNIGTATYPFDRSDAEDFTDELRAQGVLGRDEDDIEDFGARWRSEITPETPERPETQRDVSDALARVQELRNNPRVERHELVATLNLHLPSAGNG